MIYGVIGVGSIAAAIVTGLCEGVVAPPTVLLSPRNAAVAAGLAARFSTVRVCTDNQAVVDGAGTVLLCIRPHDAEAVLGVLAFRGDHAVVSAMAGVTAERLAPLVSPARNIARAIPLPAVARREGVTAIHPATEAASALFETLGGVLIPPDVAAFDALSAATGTVAAHLAALGAIARWLEAQGLGNDQAARFTASIYVALADPLRSGRDFDALTAEFTTPGGLNAMFRHHMEQAGALDAVTTGLDRLSERLAGGMASTRNPEGKRK